VIDILAVHYNGDVWKNPTVFDPDRWSPERIQEVPNLRYSWLPFSAGSRNCVGKLFAQIEAPLVAAMILQKYSLELSDDGNVFADASFVMKATNLNLKFTSRK
jgi:cytochrome P450 / NADPH-cytochrome P450 reductase